MLLIECERERPLAEELELLTWACGIGRVLRMATESGDSEPTLARFVDGSTGMGELPAGLESSEKMEKWKQGQEYGWPIARHLTPAGPFGMGSSISSAPSSSAYMSTSSKHSASSSSSVRDSKHVSDEGGCAPLEN